MRRVVTGGAVLLLLVACAGSSADPGVELTAAGETRTEAETEAPEHGCGSATCEILEGVVTHVDSGRGRLTVAVDLAWSPALRTGVGETHFTLSDTTLFLPTQTGLDSLVPGEEVLVRATPETPAGRHALSVVRVDRD